MSSQLKLKEGVLVSFKETRYLVRTWDKSLRQLTLLDGSRKSTLAFEEEVSIYADPSKEWFLVTVPLTVSPIREIRVLHRRRVTTLEILKDWVPSDMFRKGGPIYLNPSLPLTPGDVLTIALENGTFKKVPVPTTLKTFQEKMDSAKPPEAQEEVNPRDLF